MTRGKRSKPLKHDNGTGDGRRTPAQLERQERVFKLSVFECKSVRAIAAIEKISKGTVQADIRHEFALRTVERAARREHDLETALATYGSIMALAIEKSTLYDTLLGERDGAKISDHSLEAMLKARERVDKLLGLEAPTKIDLGLQSLIDAIEPK